MAWICTYRTPSGAPLKPLFRRTPSVFTVTLNSSAPFESPPPDDVRSCERLSNGRLKDWEWATLPDYCSPSHPMHPYMPTAHTVWNQGTHRDWVMQCTTAEATPYPYEFKFTATQQNTLAKTHAEASEWAAQVELRYGPPTFPKRRPPQSFFAAPFRTQMELNSAFWDIRRGILELYGYISYHLHHHPDWQHQVWRGNFVQDIMCFGLLTGPKRGVWLSPRELTEDPDKVRNYVTHNVPIHYHWPFDIPPPYIDTSYDPKRIGAADYDRYMSDRDSALVRESKRARKERSKLVGGPGASSGVQRQKKRGLLQETRGGPLKLILPLSPKGRTENRRVAVTKKPGDIAVIHSYAQVDSDDEGDGDDDDDDDGFLPRISASLLSPIKDTIPIKSADHRVEGISTDSNLQRPDDAQEEALTRARKRPRITGPPPGDSEACGESVIAPNCGPAPPALPPTRIIPISSAESLTQFTKIGEDKLTLDVISGRVRVPYGEYKKRKAQMTECWTAAQVDVSVSNEDIPVNDGDIPGDDEDFPSGSLAGPPGAVACDLKTYPALGATLTDKARPPLEGEMAQRGGPGNEKEPQKTLVAIDGAQPIAAANGAALSATQQVELNTFPSPMLASNSSQGEFSHMPSQHGARADSAAPDFATNERSVGSTDLAALQHSYQPLSKLYDERQSEYEDLERRYEAALQEISDLRAAKSSIVASRTSTPPAAVTPTSFFPPLTPDWRTLKMPKREHPVELFAQWIQFNEFTHIKGVPACAPDWVVDLRTVRGHHEVMSRVPPKHKSSQCRKARAEKIYAILNVLGIPGRYAQLLQCTGASVAPNVSYALLSLQDPPYKDEDVAKLLAAQGLTTAVADDAWLFCYHYVKATVDETSGHGGPAGALLSRVEAKLAIASRPRGLNPPGSDHFSRPINLPHKSICTRAGR